ncbi:MAG: hypothetical protein LBS56_09005, partial [Propionibacteriaceae bacterium]|nr:hypothetical protein [Propionibacteriaceae bacterium]
PFRLDGPRLAPDGVVSPTARGVTRLGGLDEASLRAVAAALPPTGVAGVGLAATGSPVTVVEADGFGRMDIDEPAQEVAWAVPLAGGGELHLRQPVTPATTARVEALLGLEAAKGRVAYVVAQRRTVAGRAIWEPVSVVRRDRDGLRLVAPDFHVEGASVLGVLQKRWRLWRRQRLDEGARAPEAPRTAVAIAADEVRDLAVDLSATGRSDLSPAGRERCLATAARCDDLALTSLAAAARRLAHAPDVEAILRACLLADRCAALGAERG